MIWPPSAHMSFPALNILFLFPRYYWVKRMACDRRHGIEAILSRTDVNAKLSGIGWWDWDNSLSARVNLNVIMPDCDLVVWYKPLGHKDCPPQNGQKSISRWITSRADIAPEEPSLLLA